MHEHGGPRFITVDLEVRSREDLAAFAAAVEPKGFVLHAGKVRRKFFVSVAAKSARPSASPEQTIWALLKVVESLPRSARKLWRQADSRIFSIGYDGGDFVTLLYERPVGSGCWYPKGQRKAEPCETLLTPELLRAVANVGGTIGTTIYPPMRRAPSRSLKRGSSATAKPGESR